MFPNLIRSEALFSTDRRYRYTLERRWDESRWPAMFCCLNPSVADETRNDPTVTRCINYARAWGYGGLLMLNIFAYRGTDPKVLKQAEDPVGPENDYWIRKSAERAGIILCAWGNHGLLKNRGSEVARLLQREEPLAIGMQVPAGTLVTTQFTAIKGLHHLGLTGANQPRHPLYLKGDLKPERWEVKP